MTDSVPVTKTPIPAVGLLCAILNFVWAAVFFLAAFGVIMAVVVGSVAGFYSTMNDQMSRMGTNATLTMGASTLVILILLVCFVGGTTFLIAGLGLLKGKRYAFFMQMILSVLGLVGFPIWTIINAAIIYAFFRPEVRNFYKV